MAQPDTRPISFTYAPLVSMWVVTFHSPFSYSDPPLHCHPPSCWLRLFSSHSFSRTNTPTFSNLVIGFLYKLTLLNSPSYIAHTVSSYIRGRKFEVSFQAATSSRRDMRARVALGGLISPVLFGRYVNDMPSPSHHVELAVYVEDTAILPKSRKPTLLVSYLESYLTDLQRWLREWKIAINVSKSTAIIFARAGRRFIQPQPVTLFGEPIKWVNTTRYLGVTLDTRLACRLTSIRPGRGLLKRWVCWATS